MQRVARAAAFVLLLTGATSTPSFSQAASEPAATQRAPTITSVSQLLQLSPQERAEEYDVRLELVALYYDPTIWKLLWARGDGMDTYLELETTSQNLRSGQRFLVEGKMVPAKGLRLASSKITILENDASVPVLSSKGRLKEAAPLSGHLVEVNGYVNRQTEVDAEHLILELDVEGQPVTARVLMDSGSPVPQVEGAYVTLRGLFIAVSDPALPLPKIDIWVPNPASVQVTGWLGGDERFEMPITMVDALPSLTPGTVVRVNGIVRSQIPGASLVLRDETGQVTLKTAMTMAMKVGDRIDAVGRVAPDGLDYVLQQSVFRSSKKQNAVVTPSLGLPLLRLVEQVRGLTPAEAEQGFKVRLRGSVTWAHPASRICFVLDASGGVAVELPKSIQTVPEVGTRVVVTGESKSGEFAPMVRATAMEFADLLPLPEARPVTLEHAMTGVEEGQWVALSGYVRAATPTEGPWTKLDLTTSGGEFTALVPSGERVDRLVGSAVKMRGVCTAETNARRQLTAIRLWVAKSADIEVEVAKPADPYATPLRTIASLRQFSTLDAFIHPVRVTGIVLKQAPGASLNLQEGEQGLLVLSREQTRLVPGDRVEAVGLPGRQSNRVVLREAVFRKVATEWQPAALRLSRLETINPELDGRLVEISGLLLDVSRRKDAIRMICQAGENIFEAVMENVDSSAETQWRPASDVALTGVYEVQYDEYGKPQSLHLHLRSPADVRVIRLASWWTSEHAVLVATLLLITVLVGIGWVVALQHRVRKQTEQIREQAEKSRSLEAELFRSSKLESLGVLAGGIAHDFNNLLTVVMGNISLVLSDQKIDEEAQHCLLDSERAAMRARDLTQQLLTFSKGGAPVRAAVLLSDVVKEAAGFALHGSNVRCNFEFAQGLWAADADKGQVAQVVHNIVINAVQAMPSGGVVRILLNNERVTSAEIPALEPGRYLKLTISDSGAGISPENLTRIFDPYFTTKQRGSGLGLATVYSIVKKHSGHLDVKSTLGKGTTFDIWLPAAADDLVVENAIGSSLAIRRSGRALVMDDEPSIRAFMTALLERMGLRVTAVEDGAAAVKEYSAALAAADRFVLVILDLTVPAGMGGAEAMAQLRMMDEEVCAIVSSGYSKDPVVADYRAHGFRGMVPKPYTIDDVTKVVAGVLPA